MNISHWNNLPAKRKREPFVMQMVVVRSTVTGEWGYCPKMAYDSFFKLNMEYCDKRSYLATAADAIAAARKDRTVPKSATFEIIAPLPVQTGKSK